ncbi:pyridoxal-dependent decarboxylase [Bacillus sp. JJ1532]
MQTQSLETPCYIIKYDELEYNYNRLKIAFTNYWQGPLKIGYSVKTNHLKWILEFMKEKEVYAEVVSNDEFRYAELVGYPTSEIIYNGPHKKADLLKRALKQGSIVNIDSFSELNVLKAMKKIEGMKVGLRVNFDLESECPGESAMGIEPSRFGFCLENGSFEKALKICNKLNILVCGLHMHQSTKTRSLNVFRALAKKAAECIKNFGLNNCLEYIDIGGGFFGGRDIGNNPSFEDYAKTISEELNHAADMKNIQLIIEPGASLISTPISYMTKVVDVRDVRGSRIITVDGSLLHINPFIADRQPSYRIVSNGENFSNRQTICGSTCMENDRLLNIENAPKLREGDIIEIEKCGSYTMSYNSCFINLPPAVYVIKGGNYELVRETWAPTRLL